MRTVESFSIAPSAKIDRTPVRVTNNCSSDSGHFTKRWADHARIEWPDNTDANWAHEAGVNIRLAQYWLEETPKRTINGAGIRAVLASMLRGE